ncbi:UDP binding domain-containing protein [Roseomonas sp. GCM10028921]
MPDTRENPVMEIFRLLEERGAVLSYHDPLVPRFPATRRLHGASPALESVALDEAVLAAQDAVLLVTPQPGMDLALVRRAAGGGHAQGVPGRGARGCRDGLGERPGRRNSPRTPHLLLQGCRGGWGRVSSPQPGALSCEASQPRQPPFAVISGAPRMPAATKG